MLHRSRTTRVRSGYFCRANSWSWSRTGVRKELNGRAGNHWCLTAKSHVCLANGQWLKMCSISSASAEHAGQVGFSWIPRWSRVAREGKELWHNCHRNTLIFGMTLSFHSQLYCHGGGLGDRVSWAFQVADLVEKVPLAVRPQQKESGTSVLGIGIPCTAWTRSGGST